MYFMVQCRHSFIVFSMALEELVFPLTLTHERGWDQEPDQLSIGIGTATGICFNLSHQKDRDGMALSTVNETRLELSQNPDSDPFLVKELVFLFPPK